MKHKAANLILIAAAIYLTGCGHDFSPIVGAWTQDHDRHIQRVGKIVLSDTTIQTSIHYDYLGDGTYHTQADTINTYGTYTYTPPILIMTDRTGSIHTTTVSRIKDYEMTQINIDSVRGVNITDSVHFTR